MVRTYRAHNEFVHWIGRFEIAQKRLLESWLDVLVLSDLPYVGTAELLAAMTDEQRLQYNQLKNDEERNTYQTTLKEQTITNRRNQHQQNFPLNLLSLIFSVQADLSEQQTERMLCLVNEHQANCNASVYISPG